VANKTRYMIVAGASVVVIRDGKRQAISAGGGADFSEDEIATILRGAPGALRTPINEGRGKRVADDADESEDADDGAEVKTVTKTTKTPGKKTAKGSKTKAPAEKPAPDSSDDDDDGEDEDI